MKTLECPICPRLPVHPEQPCTDIWSELESTFKRLVGLQGRDLGMVLVGHRARVFVLERLALPELP
jgi:hypothetical protein